MTAPRFPFDPAQDLDLSGVDFSTLPRLRPVAQPGAFASGLRTGVNELQALGGAAVGATGRALGMPGITQWGEGAYANQMAEAAAVSRPDLDAAPWRANGAPVGAWLAYQAARQLPQLVPQLGAAYLSRGRTAPAWLARIGASLPTAIGGGGLRAGASVVAREAAMEAGKELAAGVTAATVAGLPQAVGSMYGEAIERGNPTRADAFKALGMAPVYSALDALEPASLTRLAAKGSAGNFLKRIATAGAIGAVTEMPQEAAQTAMELTFRPDISPADKMRQVVDAAVTGGAIGGLFGGLGGIRRMKGLDPTTATTDDLNAVADEVLDLPPEGAEAAPTASTTPAATAPNFAPVEPTGDQLDAFAPPVEAAPAAPAVAAPALPDQSDLFDGVEMPTAPVPAPTRADNVTAMRELARQAVGRNTPFTKKVDAADEVELADAVLARLESGSAATDTMALGRFFGLIDEAGNARDLDAEVATKQAQLDAFGTAYPRERVQVERDLSELQMQQQIVNEMQARRAARTAPTTSEVIDGREVAAPVPAEAGNGPTVRQREDGPAVRQEVGPIEGLDEEIGGEEVLAEEGHGEEGVRQEDVAPAPAPRAIDTPIAAAVPSLKAIQQQYKVGRTKAQAIQAELRAAAIAPVTTSAAPAAPLDRALATADAALAEPPAPAKSGISLAEIDALVAEAKAAQAAPVAAVAAPGVAAAPAVAPKADIVQGAVAQFVAARADNPKLMVPGVAAIRRQYGIGDTPARAIQAGMREAIATPVAPITTSEAISASPAVAPADNAAPEIPAAASPEVAVEPAVAPVTRDAAAVETPDSANATRSTKALQARVADWTKKRDRPAQSATAKAYAQERIDQAQAELDRRSAEPRLSTADPTVDATDTAASTAETISASYGYRGAQTIAVDTGHVLVRVENRIVGALPYLVVNTETQEVYPIAKSGLRPTPQPGAPSVGVWARMVQKAQQHMQVAEGVPEGPFSRNPGKSIVRTDSVPLRYEQYVRGLLDTLGLTKTRVFLFDTNDIEGDYTDGVAHGLIGSYAIPHGAMETLQRADGAMLPFTPSRPDFGLMIDTMLSPERALEVLAHEVGHYVEYNAYQKAPDATKYAVHSAYTTWRAENLAKSDKDLVLSLRNTFTGEVHAQGKSATDRTLGDDYWTSFEEWFADQVSKWATSTAKPQGLVEQFFSDVAKLLRKLYATVTNRPVVAAPMQEFLDNMGPGTLTADRDGDIIDTRGFGAGYVAASAPEMTDQVRTTTSRAVSALNLLDRRESLTVGTRKALLGASSITHLVARFAKLFPQLGAYATAMQERAATSARFSQLFSNTYYAYESIEKTKPKAAELVRRLMSYTEFEIDPAKSWADHKWLAENPNKANLQRLVGEANADYRKLRQMQHGAVYTNFRAVNEAIHFAMMAVSLHNLVVSDPSIQQIPGFDIDPTDQFRAQAALHESPTNARDYWQQVLTTQTAAVQQYLAAQKGEADADTTTTAQQNKIKHRIRPIEMRVRSIEDSLAAMAQAPYFHLGRFGEYFVGFSLRSLGDTKAVDPAAIEHVSKVLRDAGFRGAQLSRDSTKSNVYLRVETADQAKQLETLVLGLQKSGWLNRDVDVVRGRRAAERAATQVAPEWLNRYIENLQASEALDPTDDMTPEQREQQIASKTAMIANARELWLDMLPDTALSKVMVHRNATLGYDKDMVRNFAYRMQVGVNALSNLSAAGKVTQAFTEMRSAVRGATRNTDMELSNVVAMQDILGEVARREAARPMTVGRTLFDTWRAVNHTFFLGLSPSYGVVNLTQLGVLLWPELAKNHGFAKSAKAIWKATPTAFRVMRATLKVGVAAGGKRAADAIITQASLTQSGIPESTAEFIMQVVNTGNIDIGSAARELGRVADGKMDSKTDLALRVASSIGYYTETFTRLVAALSARELHGDKPGLNEYVNSTVNESMLNYSTWNTARLTGKAGPLGAFSPVAFSFMTYQFQVIEKLYREIATAFVDRAASDTEKAAARKFLGAHLVAMTTVAGSLGMPAASVLARAVEALKDLFDDDDEPFDAKSAWRNFLAETFGPEVGEVLSRGVFRAAGVDISTRAGEQDILPFSRLLTDRRKWQDASKDWAMQAMGAPVSMLNSIVQGGTMMMDGDVLGGMKAMVPVAIKGPTEAYRMATEGYVDAAGNKLPMTPGATAILAQLMGFTPAEKAEYSEAKMAQTVRKGTLVQRASVLRRNLALAVERKDRDAFRETMQEARAFDRANPAYAVIPSLGEAVKRRAKARTMARQSSNPLGTNPRDRGAQRLTGFANFGPP